MVAWSNKAMPPGSGGNSDRTSGSLRRQETGRNSQRRRKETNKRWEEAALTCRPTNFRCETRCLSLPNCPFAGVLRFKNKNHEPDSFFVPHGRVKIIAKIPTRTFRPKSNRKRKQVDSLLLLLLAAFRRRLHLAANVPFHLAYFLPDSRNVSVSYQRNKKNTCLWPFINLSRWSN